jgi:CubicO group peptidase (beta-lactamase class C family)
MSLAALIWIAFALSQPDPLLGLWGSESSFGPQVRGELTLERNGSAWTMRAGGFEASFAASGDEIRGALPGGNGELRAHFEDGGNVIRGFWIQPRGNLGQFATPVTLERVRADGWRGSIAPLEDRLSMYLLIRRGDDGSLRGSFHNPEVNWNGRAPWFRVVRKDESLELIDPATGKVRFVQPYDAGQRQIGMDFGAPIALTPRTPDQAAGFYPRSPAAAPYRYRPPLAASDGWQTARARDVGMDEELLRALVERIIAADPAAADAPRIHSLLVARHGKLVLEEYFYGFTAERPHDLRSASKTFTSLMAGIAMDRDKSLTIDSPADPARATITLKHLLTHSSGLACDDNDDASPGNEDTMQRQQKQNDWYRYFLDLPVVHPPGTKYAYCSAGINLAAGVVARSSGTWLPDFFDRHIARPLQLERYAINLMPDGQAYGGGGIYMRPRDFLKLGQTYLGGGVWNGKRIVSEEWVRTSTSHQIKTGDGGSDGYGWHRHTLGAAGRQHPEYEASGNGGQFVIVVPGLDLAVAITAGNYNQYGVWRTFRDELVPKYILSAVVRPALYDEIARADAALFDAFNAHDLAKVKTFFAEDLEFFHDTGGLLSFKSAMAGFESNFAKNNGLRRDLVEGSLEVHPIRDYGAIQTGAHTFCHVENGANECGTFKFVHVWKKKDGRWQITRAISYDH